jgi:hypothetical protein
MAKLTLLTNEQLKNGYKPKPYRPKSIFWRKACFVLSLVILVENIVLVYFGRI